MHTLFRRVSCQPVVTSALIREAALRNHLKLRWLRDNNAAAQSSEAVFGTLSSYLVRRLTENTEDAIDHTHAARTPLMNINSLAWDEELPSLFGLTGIRLPTILPAAPVFGETQTPAGDVPLLAFCDDRQAAMLGLGVIE